MDARLLPMGRTAVLVEVEGTPHAVALRLAVGGRIASRHHPWARTTAVGVSPVWRATSSRSGPS
jgi:hypothetical protein